MRHHVVSGLGVILVAGLVPGAAPAVAPASSEVQRAVAACVAQGGTGAVQTPKLVRQIATGETGWFSSPGLVDLDGDGRLEIVAPFYSTFVFDARGTPAGPGPGEQGPGLRAVGGRRPRRRRRPRDRGRRQRGHGGGVRAPRRPAAAARPGGRRPPAAAASRRRPRAGRRRPRRRRPGRGRGDDDEHVADRRAGLRVRRERRGCSSRRAPPRLAPLQPAPAGQRPGFNGVGNHGYGAYGENVGIGNIDDDPELEIIVTFDNHQINVFNLDGTSILASPWFTNRESGATGAGGWAGDSSSGGPSPQVERRHYHLPHGRVAEPGATSPGCSGRPHRRRSPTSTATAATR